jgi:hypothetical protein
MLQLMCALEFELGGQDARHWSTDLEQALVQLNRSAMSSPALLLPKNRVKAPTMKAPTITIDTQCQVVNLVFVGPMKAP